MPALRIELDEKFSREKQECLILNPWELEHMHVHLSNANALRKDLVLLYQKAIKNIVNMARHAQRLMYLEAQVSSAEYPLLPLRPPSLP